MISINSPVISDEEIKLVTQVLRSSKLTSGKGEGPFVKEFESKYAEFIGVKHAVALTSGTVALRVALETLNLKPRDEVIIPSFTFKSVANAILEAGGKPVFVDIDLDTYCMNPEELEESITDKTRAIIPVHLFGLSCAMDEVNKVAEACGASVIEDGAQAIGAEYRGKKVGSLGDMACFSFYATKNITTGEGGMITTDDDEYARKIREIRSIYYRLTEIQAAIGIVQLRKLPEFLKARRRNAKMLADELAGIEKIQVPVEPKGLRHSWNLFTIRLKGSSKERNGLVERLRKEGIEAKVYYETPIHLMPRFHNFCCGRRLINTEIAANQVLSLPIHPGVTEDDIDHMAKIIKQYCADLRSA